MRLARQLIAILATLGPAPFAELDNRSYADPESKGAINQNCEVTTVVPSNNMPSDERSILGMFAAHSRDSRGLTNTEPARKARWDKYLDQVDPDRMLQPAERERRAIHARRAEMASLALKSAKARRERRQTELEVELFGGPA